MQKGFHFNNGKTLRNGASLPLIGEWAILGSSVPIKLCESGFHGSKHPFDALQYAPGSTLDWCDFGDIKEEQLDKFVSNKRKRIASIDATVILWEMARWSALQVIKNWNPKKVVLNYLETGNNNLKSDAWSAARSASWSAIWSTAWSAVESAARSAAYSAAESAADFEAESAARSAADSAARSAAYSAARSAADFAAEDAARNKQGNHFLFLVVREFAKQGVNVYEAD